MDLIPVIAGHIVTDQCACGQPGSLIPDPSHDGEPNAPLVVLCDTCANETFLDT